MIVILFWENLSSSKTRLQVLLRISNLLEEHCVTSHCMEPSGSLCNNHVKKILCSKVVMMMMIVLMIYI